MHIDDGSNFRIPSLGLTPEDELDRPTVYSVNQCRINHTSQVWKIAQHERYCRKLMPKYWTDFLKGDCINSVIVKPECVDSVGKSIELPPVGYAAMKVDKHNGNLGIIHSVCVYPEFRRLGLGRRMIDRLLHYRYVSQFIALVPEQYIEAAEFLRRLNFQWAGVFAEIDGVKMYHMLHDGPAG